MQSRVLMFLTSLDNTYSPRCGSHNYMRLFSSGTQYICFIYLMNTIGPVVMLGVKAVC